METNNQTPKSGGTGEHISVDINKAQECSNSSSGDYIASKQVQSTGALVSSIREKMEAISPLHCIYRVPENIRRTSEPAYVPKTVSLGPFHHGKEDLKSMDEHKWRYMHALLSRKPNMDRCLDDCVKVIMELEVRVRKCYGESVSLSSDEFVQMMVVDGCFIIELLLRYSSRKLRRRGDPVFSEPGKLFSVRRDMFLLENQLPFFLLQGIFNTVSVPKHCGKPLTELSFCFFRIMLSGDEQAVENKFTQPGNHFLDFLSNCYLPSTPRVPSNPNVAERTIHAAKQLQRSGVKLKKKMGDSLLDIKFIDGVLKMPPIQIHNYTDSLLRNLIALEQCSTYSSMYVTSYAFVMAGLILTPEDVDLLRQCRILSSFSSNEETSLLFKKLCVEVGVKDFYYAGLCEQVNSYGRKKWSMSLKCCESTTTRRYRIVMIAILSVLIIIGTLFSVLSFYVHHG